MGLRGRAVTHDLRPSWRRRGAMGCQRPLLDEISSGCLTFLEPSSKSSLFELTHVKTLILTCLASFVLQGSILTFDPGAKAEMARQRSCCRIRGSISSHL